MKKKDSIETQYVSLHLDSIEANYVSLYYSIQW